MSQLLLHPEITIHDRYTRAVTSHGRWFPESISVGGVERATSAPICPSDSSHLRVALVLNVDHRQRLRDGAGKAWTEREFDALRSVGGYDSTAVALFRSCRGQATERNRNENTPARSKRRVQGGECVVGYVVLERRRKR